MKNRRAGQMTRVAGVCAGLAMGSSAFAQYVSQNANGRALERDLRVGGTGNAPRADFAAEVAFRNAMVTGNAPGGLSLRSSVNYSAPGDFRDTLGDAQNFAFRRDSISSGLGGMGFRGTESLQYQFSVATGLGNAPSRLVYGRDVNATPVAATGTSSTGVLNSQATTPSFGVSGWQSPSGTLRSTSSYTANRALAPVVLSTRESDQGQVITATSGLLGVKYIPTSITAAPLTPEPLRTLGEQPREAPIPGAGSESAVLPATERPVSAGYEQFRARLDNFAGTQRATKPATSDLPKATPTDEPSKSDRPAPGTPTDDRDAKSTSTQDRLNDLRALLLGRGTSSDSRTSKPGDPRAAEANTSTPQLDRELLGVIRKAGEDRTTSLSGPSLSTADAYGRALKDGEDKMRERRYLDAEEKFSFALQIRRGDISAMAGRINAQLAAGLLLSASVNLKTLVTEHPEAIGMRFGEALMPDKARQTELLQLLRANLTESSGITQRLPRESALLLAYLGYQRNDEPAIREGLILLRREAKNQNENTLWIDVLEGVWLGNPGPANP